MIATGRVIRQWRIGQPEGLAFGVLVWFDLATEHIRLYEGVDPEATDPDIDSVLSVSGPEGPEPREGTNDVQRGLF